MSLLHHNLIWKSLRISQVFSDVSCYDKHVVVPIALKIALPCNSLLYSNLAYDSYDQIKERMHISNAFLVSFFEYAMRQGFLRLMALIGRTCSGCSRLESFKMLEGSFRPESRMPPMMSCLLSSVMQMKESEGNQNCWPLFSKSNLQTH